MYVLYVYITKTTIHPTIIFENKNKKYKNLIKITKNYFR